MPDITTTSAPIGSFAGVAELLRKIDTCMLTTRVPSRPRDRLKAGRRTRSQQDAHRPISLLPLHHPVVPFYHAVGC